MPHARTSREERETRGHQLVVVRNLVTGNPSGRADAGREGLAACARAYTSATLREPPLQRGPGITAFDSDKRYTWRYAGETERERLIAYLKFDENLRGGQNNYTQQFP